jgi:phenylacetate-CoA ligase
MSSFGVGELGLHLCHETPATIALRRRALRDGAVARAIGGHDAGATTAPLPIVFTFDPLRTYIEILDQDAGGFGKVTISMLDESRTIPLLRYQTGDVARLLDRDEILATLQAHRIVLPNLPHSLLALRGRDKELLPNGGHVAVYKDALYADHQVAQRLTGAFRVTFDGGTCEMHVQLQPTETGSALVADRIASRLALPIRPARVVAWRYEEFPFGMTLDYERKFCHYAAGANAARRRPGADEEPRP